MSAQATEWRAALDHLLDTLRAAQEQRSLRQDYSGDEPAWVTYEREVMTDEVNKLRSRRGRYPISIDEVARKERMACGHIDYTKKYALYCAELAVIE
jgi:hypothetical protein